VANHLDLARLGRLTQLGAGGQGVVFAAPSLRMQYASSLVFKQYRPDVARRLDIAVLDSMPAYLESLPFAEGMELLSQAAWPCRLVEDRGAVAGFVMPAIPDGFFMQMRKSSGLSRELGEFQHLLNDDSFLARRQIALSDRRRYELLGEAARALSVFHRHGIAVGDLSPKNLLYAWQAPAVYFIDCDAMRFQGRSVMSQLETPGWEVRAASPGEELGTTASDGYKLGLLALRLLAGSQDVRDPARLPRAVPTDVRRLIEAALSPDPTRRPSPADWDTPLAKAASSASTALPQMPVSTTLPRMPVSTTATVLAPATVPGFAHPPLIRPPQAVGPGATGTGPAAVGQPAPARGGPPPAPSRTLTDLGLSRAVGRVGLTMSSVGSIFGAGWLFGAVYAAAIAGTAALLAWIIAGVAVLILALVHAELGAMYPVAGGPARYPQHAFGNIAGASFAWFSWLQAVTIAPIEVFATERYLSYWQPGLWGSTEPTGAGYFVAILLMAAFALVNFFGVRWLASANSLLTWCKLAVPAVVVVFLLTKMHGGSFGAGGFMPYGAKSVLSALSSGGVVFAYLGFEQAGQLAGEARNPQRDVPWAIIASVIIAIMFYVLLQVVFIGALPRGLVANGFSAISNNAIVTDGFTGLTSLLGLGGLAFLIRLSSVIGPVGTGLIYSGATTRVSYGAARSGYSPAVFAKTSRRGVPWAGLLVAFVLGLLFMLPSPQWSNLVGDATDASLLMYAGAPLALGAFRRQHPSQPRPYRMPGAGVLAPVAFVVANLLIFWSDWASVWRLGIAILIGYVAIGLTWLFSKQQRPTALGWRQAGWIPVYLVGIGVISALGSYGGGNHLGMGWDVVVVALFSLVIYSWAVRTRP
jgi:amino acid transporter